MIEGKKLKTKIRKELIKGVLLYSRDTHPNEIILLLRRKGGVEIELVEVVIPPLAVQGQNFSEFKPYLLPFNSSIIGLVHSHPSGVLKPSIYDFNHFYGKIMMIVAYPYRSIRDITIFDREGRLLPFKVVS